MVYTFSQNWALYRRLLSYLGRYWQVFIGSLLCMLVAAATEPAFVALMKPLVDEGFVAKDIATLETIPLLIIGLFLVRGVSSFGNAYCTSWLTGQLVQTLRQDVFDQLVRMPVSYYDMHPSGRLLSRVIYDVDQVTAAGFNILTVTIKDGATILSLLAILLYYDWQLAMICLIVFPWVSFCIRKASVRLRYLAQQSQQQMAQLTQVLGDNIDHQRMVKIYGGEKYEAARFMQAARDIRHNNVKQAAASALNTGLTQFIISLALAGVLYYAALRAQNHSLTAGTFMAFLTGMSALFAPIKRMTNIAQSLQSGLAAAHSVFQFLDEPAEEDQGTIQITKTQGALSFQQVSFRYPQTNHHALNQIDLMIQAGETLALVGSSGSGKSTLVSLLPRFYQPTQGRILLDGIDLNDIKLASLRQQMALVSQDIVLLNDTIAANIAYGPLAECELEKIIAAADQANALGFIEEMEEGFNTLIGENGVRLSGGQRQRLAIARALLKNAPILILDEATSALDNQTEYLVQTALENLIKNRTTIIIAHRLSTIEKADRIIVLQQGKIVESGSHQALLDKKEHYAQLYQNHQQKSSHAL